MDVNRRRLFGFAATAALAAPAAAQAIASTGTQPRVSCEAGDPGERLYSELCGDGKVVTVYLNGQEVAEAVTADPGQGYVKRAVTTQRGNIAINHATGEIQYETVHGAVRWEAREGRRAVVKARADDGSVRELPGV